MFRNREEEMTVTTEGGYPSLSVFPDPPTHGWNATVSMTFSGTVYNTGTEDVTVTVHWEIRGEVNNSGDIPVPVDKKSSQNFGGEYPAEGIFEEPGPHTETGTYTVLLNGIILAESSSSLTIQVK
jgi:hypothetical protein